MITFIAVLGDWGPVTLHARRAPWSVFQDGSVSLAYAGGAVLQATQGLCTQRRGRALPVTAGDPTRTTRRDAPFDPFLPLLRAPWAGLDPPPSPLAQTRGKPCATALGRALRWAPADQDRGMGRQRAGSRGRPQPTKPTGPFRANPYSATPAELRRRVHRARLDDLLALLPECFAQFPHGTYMLSGSWFEI